MPTLDRRRFQRLGDHVVRHNVDFFLLVAFSGPRDDPAQFATERAAPDKLGKSGTCLRQCEDRFRNRAARAALQRPVRQKLFKRRETHYTLPTANRRRASVRLSKPT